MEPDPIGRVAERDAAERLLDRMRDGPSALLLEGEAGIGKTTLWAATLERARSRGHRVLHARTAPAESGLSYAALADLLADVPPAASASLPEVQRDELGRRMERETPDSREARPS